MKFLKLFVFLIFFSASTFAQSDTTKYFRSPDYGWIFKRIKPHIFLPPTDTAVNKFGLAVRNGVMYLGNGTYWSASSGGGGSMVYPGAGIPLSNGSAWLTSITDNSANWNTAYTDRNKWDGGADGLTAATGRTSLGGTTIGQNMFTSTNPSAIRFGRANADNSFSWLDAAAFRTAIGTSLLNVTTIDNTTTTDIKISVANKYYYGNGRPVIGVNSVNETDVGAAGYDQVTNVNGFGNSFIRLGDGENSYYNGAHNFTGYALIDATNGVADHALNVKATGSNVAKFESVDDEAYVRIKGSGISVLAIEDFTGLRNAMVGFDGYFNVNAGGDPMLLNGQGGTVTVGSASPLDSTFNVNGSLYGTGNVRFSGMQQRSLDTTNYKIGVLDASGTMFKMYWPTGGGSMVYPGAGIAVSNGSAWTTSITDNSANWNTAYTDRNKWDGGATGLVAATGRTSLGLVIGTDVLAPNGSAAALTGFPTFNQNTTGSAATLTTTRTIWGQNFNGSANVTGLLALGANDLTMSGSLAATGARVTKGWFTDIESTNMPTVGGTSLSATFSPIAGSASITTVGTVGTGTWQGSVIGSTYGGTGINNAGRTLTINTNSGTINFSGASKTLTVPDNASVTGTNTGDQTTITGNAGTATTLQNTRTIWGQNFNGSANVTGLLALGANDLTMTGSLAATGARVTKGWFTDIESTNPPTVGGVALPTATSTTTWTNKRWTARVGSTTSSATPTINTDNVDVYKLTAQTANITSFTTNLTGTPNDGDILEIQITGTAARTIAWGASFVSSTVTLPTTTVTTATLTTVLQWFTTSSYGNNKWVCVNSF